jgi:UDP-glucose 4-epimerase
MRVLLTGGAGYVGSALVGRLCQRPDLSEIVVYDNLGRGRGLFLQGPARPVAPVRLVQADLLDTRSLMAALRGVDVVVHLAARVTTPYAHDDLHGFDQVNRWGTGELGLAVERVGGVRRVVYASSTAVYGDTQGGPASAARGTPPAPVSAYGHAKLEGERLLGELDPAVALTVLRLGNVHGLAPAMRFDSLVNRMLFDAWTAGRVQVEGSGDEHRPLLHVESAARALEAAALGELPTGTLDLVDANARTLDVVRALRAFLPQTEALFISQHLTLPDAVVNRDPRLPAALHDDRPLAAQLDEEARRFAFGGPRA